MVVLPKVQSKYYSGRFTALLALMLLLVLFGAPQLSAAPNSKSDDQLLLHESEYRSELEEVVVVGRQPEWRQAEQKEQWRPDSFELPDQSSKSRMQWLPEYTKEDRDNYNEVRDRTGEKPEFKLFNWKF